MSSSTREALERMTDGLLEQNTSLKSAKESHQLSLSEPTLFVDVRAQEEYKVSTIPGAVHVSEFESTNLSDLRQENLVFFCTVGYRSGKYVKHVQKKYGERLKGKNLYNMKGSILDWCHEETCPKLIEPETQTVTNKVHCYGKSWNYLPDGYEPVYFSWLQQTVEGAKWALLSS